MWLQCLEKIIIIIFIIIIIIIISSQMHCLVSARMYTRIYRPLHSHITIRTTYYIFYRRDKDRDNPSLLLC